MKILFLAIFSTNLFLKSFKVPGIVFLMVILNSGMAFAQLETTDFPFIEEINHPYSLALGEADLTMFSSGGLVHLNPAFGGRRESLRLGSNFTPRFIIVPDFKTQPNREYAPEIFYIVPYVGYESNGWDFSYQFRYYDFGVQRMENDPRFRGAEGIQELAVVRHHSDRLSLGSSLNFYQSDRGLDPAGTTTGLSIHFGAIYRRDYPLPDFRFSPAVAWSLTNFGRPVEYALGAGNSPQPTTMRLGSSMRFEFYPRYRDLRVVAFTAHGALSRLIIGYNTVTLKPYGPFEALLRSWENYRIREGNELIEITVADQIRRHAGLEVEVLEILKLRAGYRFRGDEVRNREIYTIGFGIDMDYIRLDFAHILGEQRSEFGNTMWMLSLSAPLEWVVGFFDEEE